MANKKYKLTDGNMWATDGIHDFGQNKTQRTINSEVNSALGGKAPTNHASTATTYGAASTSNYGHVKLSNTTPSMDGTAAVGDSTDVARANHVHPSDTSRVPTSRKVNNKQLSSDITLSAADVSAVPTSRKVNDKQLSADITLSASDVGAAPTSHASTATTYGKGTSSNYGHVKISDSLTDTTTAATGGVVPSMKAVSDLNGAITSHASTLTGLENAIGYIETSSTASRNYVKDDYFFLTTNNRLYQATAAITSGTSIEGKIRWIPIGGFNHQRFKRICTSNTWSGSASDQVLPTLPITGSLSDYSEIKFVLRLASQAAEQTFMTDLILDGTIKYMYIPFVQDSQYFASCIVEYSSGSLKVNNYITTNSGWYSTTKQLYVYGK